MGKRRILLVLSIVLLFLVSACGTSGNALKKENKTMTVIRHGENISQSADAELLGLLETIVSEECKAPRMLNLRLPLSEVEAYKEDGTYIEIMYENGKAFPVMADSSEVVIDEVHFLIGKEPSNCYVCYDTENAYCIFFLSQASCDEIRMHLD